MSAQVLKFRHNSRTGNTVIMITMQMPGEYTWALVEKGTYLAVGCDSFETPDEAETNAFDLLAEDVLYRAHVVRTV